MCYSFIQITKAIGNNLLLYFPHINTNSECLKSDRGTVSWILVRDVSKYCMYIVCMYA